LKGSAEMCHEPPSMGSAGSRSSRDRIMICQMTEAERWLETCNYYILNSTYLFESKRNDQEEECLKSPFKHARLQNKKCDKTKTGNFVFVFSLILTSCIITAWCQPKSQEEWRWNWFRSRTRISYSQTSSSKWPEV